jgi:hypothetical protein
MFERFTEEARRSLFFSRAKAAERLGDAISVRIFWTESLWEVPRLSSC